MESQVIEFKKLKIKCQTAKDDLLTVLKKEEILKKQLEKEQEIISIWKFGRDVAANIIPIQKRETFVKKIFIIYYHIEVIFSIYNNLI